MLGLFLSALSLSLTCALSVSHLSHLSFISCASLLLTLSSFYHHTPMSPFLLISLEKANTLPAHACQLVVHKARQLKPKTFSSGTGRLSPLEERRKGRRRGGEGWRQGRTTWETWLLLLLQHVLFLKKGTSFSCPHSSSSSTLAFRQLSNVSSSKNIIFLCTALWHGMPNLLLYLTSLGRRL